MPQLPDVCVCMCVCVCVCVYLCVCVREREGGREKKTRENVCRHFEKKKWSERLFFQASHSIHFFF